MADIEPTIGRNYIDALDAVQGSLDQLQAEVVDNPTATERIDNIKKALAEITPARDTETA